VVHQLVRVVISFNIKRNMPKLMAQDFFPVFVSNVVPAFLIKGDDKIIAFFSIRIFCEVLHQVIRLENPSHNNPTS